MRALVQRVSQASVSIDGEITGSIDAGLVILVGIHEDDDEEDVTYIVSKTLNLRIFRFDRSALDIHANLLVISQFTLYGDTRRGRRPSFSHAMPPEPAAALFDCTLRLFEQTGLNVQTGQFQAHMLVSIHNDGPGFHHDRLC
ncbi:D-aminoacyl-tRNA deacylase [Geodia barretti]|uniref:D-aminoacyl-tRNA deacylase n=1 Tax=Geodia barretti TaxID=519541 RepID=A0AA35RQ84_GEOBA|nr:D-aminoacyl-tRNA deacylase [Geodia barretti]